MIRPEKYHINEDRQTPDVTALFHIANELAQLNEQIEELIRLKKIEDFEK
tara:strand:+ start:320 stop:469 length:150 start_codon:yes stop_codon:yes gene_type:complete